ncbi:transcriptional regulator TetR family [Patulibacter medicamentivorans]|uniref:Transcriptional regulator TetR family n=1 Tax=Patulibacter medicamentivorans TaxID=1097667 RepID=H0EA54_9ACTN|nr:TetR/AcrR family transcriptional regulator [Patulibacter medicamentivorans]EHN09394.1 transcriptional regulator TetR family [Patulibacter medicamentivorans]
MTDLGDPATEPPATAGAPAERPLRADAERNRRRILQAAREVFTEQGLGVTMDDIAKHAGVGVGTVYRRFPEKGELIDALFEERVSEIVALAEEGLTIEDPWEGFVHFLRGQLELQAADRGLKELLISHGHGSNRVTAARSRIAPIAIQLFTRAQQAGVIRADVAPTDVPMIGMTLGSLVDYTRESHPDAWRRLLAIVLDGLRVQPEVGTPLPAEPLTFEQLDQSMACWKSGRR